MDNLIMTFSNRNATWQVEAGSRPDPIQDGRASDAVFEVIVPAP